MTIERITEILETSIAVGWISATITATTAETKSVSASPGVLGMLVPSGTSGAALYPGLTTYPAAALYLSDGLVDVRPYQGSTALWPQIPSGSVFELKSGGIAFSSLSLVFSGAGSCRVLYRGKI